MDPNVTYRHTSNGLIQPKDGALTVNECHTLLGFQTDSWEPAPMIRGRRRTQDCLEMVKRGVLTEKPGTVGARRYKVTELGIQLHAQLERVLAAVKQVTEERAQERAA